MKNLHRSRIFRYAVAYTGLFFISTLLVLTFLYAVTFQISDNKIEARVSHEAQWLGEILADCSEFEKVSRLNFHIADHPGNLGVYLLLDGDGKRLAGNLDLIPDVELVSGKFISFFHQVYCCHHSTQVSARSWWETITRPSIKSKRRSDPQRPGLWASVLPLG